MHGLVERILIVDDQKDIREVIMMLFEDMECVECFVASDGAEALKILDEYPIHVLVTDVKMPKLNGVDLCCEVRERGFKGPIVVITGEASGEDYRRLCQLQVSNVHLKPVDLNVLRDSLRELLHKEILKVVEDEVLNAITKELGESKEYYTLSSSEKVGYLLPQLDEQ